MLLTAFEKSTFEGVVVLPIFLSFTNTCKFFSEIRFSFRHILIFSDNPDMMYVANLGMYVTPP